MEKQCGDRRILKANWRYIAELCIAVPIIFTVLFGVTMFGKNLLMTFPLGIRMMLMLVMQWSLLVVPVILMAKNRWTLSDLGFTKERLAGQILIGVLLAVLMSAVFTVIPILAGFESSVVGNQYTQVWQFAFDFVYKLAAVALAEEIVFRGYIYRLLTKIWDNEWFAIIISSLLFGLFHIFGGSVVQIVMTAFLGFLFCILRRNIKNCTLLSLIIVHGIYDWLIAVWGYLL